MLLFLGISYVIWASVTIRWIAEFVEQEHPLTGLITAILLLFGLLMGLEPLITKDSLIRGHLYMIFQMSLVITASLLFYELDFFALLYLPLVGQAAFIFPQRTAIVWVAILLLATFVGQIQQFGWPEGLPFILLYSAGLVFVAAFSLLSLQAEASRQKSEALLSELQEAHQQLQAYAGQAEELAIANERNRLARELHDSIAQTLYGLSLQSEVASRRLAAGRLEQVAQYLQDFRHQTQQTLRETRLMIYELRPPILEQVGLATALQSRIDAVERRGGLLVEANLEEMEGLSAELEVGLYRLAQEALNNALKHAEANNINLELANREGNIFLQIADDGRGFDTAIASQQGGYGLNGMRERANQLGGSLNISSVPGEGTTVTVEVPL
jgi:signal transduction histidine kinase